MKLESRADCAHDFDDDTTCLICGMPASLEDEMLRAQLFDLQSRLTEEQIAHSVTKTALALEKHTNEATLENLRLFETAFTDEQFAHAKTRAELAEYQKHYQRIGEIINSEVGLNNAERRFIRIINCRDEFRSNGPEPYEEEEQP